MPDVYRVLGNGLVNSSSGSAQTVYTPLSGQKATIMKSMILNNSSASAVIVNVIVNGYYLLFGYSIKPGESIVVPVLDQVLSGTGDLIRIGASVSSVVSYYISGVEYDTNDSSGDYYYARRMARTSVAANEGGKLIVPQSNTKRIIKSLVVANVNGSEVTLGVSFAGTSVVSGFKLKAYDTIVVPTFDAVLEDGQTIACSASGLVSVHVSGKEVV
ncbi:hypothetical protein BK131_03540 [Paenibacillus amylolyticus]|uniref:Uncharacterized protein n=1 Tax=Paenibacillus amylolyticus TaxID=1451 RepID=A0A1R1C4S7_PAEAM|nr:hypothetical protein [Paenibacillus amylolyticus]OMF17059.1 hypothetical protein BK131_03540 [Paenibacillus amylolyticus]